MFLKFNLRKIHRRRQNVIRKKMRAQNVSA